jgi:hypothetical protein
VAEAARVAFAVFADLGRSRLSSGFGPQSLQWGQIADWQRLMQITLPAWLVEAVMAIDGAYLAALAERTPAHADRRLQDHLHR